MLVEGPEGGLHSWGGGRGSDDDAETNSPGLGVCPTPSPCQCGAGVISGAFQAIKSGDSPHLKALALTPSCWINGGSAPAGVSVSMRVCSCCLFLGGRAGNLEEVIARPSHGCGLWVC